MKILSGLALVLAIWVQFGRNNSDAVTTTLTTADNKTVEGTANETAQLGLSLSRSW